MLNVQVSQPWFIQESIFSDKSLLSLRVPSSWMLYSSFHVKQLYAFPSTITKPWQPISALSNSSLTVPNISITMQIGPLSSAIGHLFSSEMLWFSVSEWVALKLLVKNLPVASNQTISPHSISINKLNSFLIFFVISEQVCTVTVTIWLYRTLILFQSERWLTSTLSFKLPHLTNSHFSSHSVWSLRHSEYYYPISTLLPP